MYEQSKNKTNLERDRWDKAKILAYIVSVIAIPVIIVIVANIVNLAIKNRDIRLRMIELAVDILKVNPSTTVQDSSLRTWAINIIDEYSEIPISREVREALSKAPIVLIKSSGFEGDAEVELISYPPGAEVYLIPMQFPEVRIPALSKTPTKMSVLASEYEVVFTLGGKEIKTEAAVYYNRKNRVEVTFK